MAPETVEVSAHVVGLASAIVPIACAAGLWAYSPPDHRRQGSIALATTWNATFLLAFNALAVRIGWWHFVDAGPTIAGFPMVLWFGWTLLWGTIAAQSRFHPVITVALLAAFDLIYMPLMPNVVVLSDNWIVGEGVLLLFVALPSLFIVRWTDNGTRLRERVLFQVAMFGGLLLWVIPILATSAAGQDLHLDVPHLAYGAVLFGVGGAALPALISVHDFFRNGGTPWPWESTDRAVLSGPYRYARSPMQASGSLLLFTMAFLYGEPVIVVAAATSLLYGAMFCSIEAPDLTTRFGPEWADLADSQRRWIPSWKPSPLAQPGTVWVNFGCQICRPIAGFLERRSPVQLEIRDAADHSQPLDRLRYEGSDGSTHNGVAAVGASLEHLNLAWAMLGWTLRTPGLVWLWTLIGDASGFGPRPVSSSTVQPLRPLSELP